MEGSGVGSVVATEHGRSREERWKAKGRPRGRCMVCKVRKYRTLLFQVKYCKSKPQTAASLCTKFRSPSKVSKKLSAKHTGFTNPLYTVMSNQFRL